MTTNRVKNIIKNYKSYVSEYKLMMRRVDNNNKVLDEESYRYVQFIHISRYGHLIDTQIKSLDEIENIFYGANPSNLIERIIKDYNEIDTWLKLVKAKNPVLKKYEMNGSTHLYFSKNLNHEHSKIVLSYIAMLDSFEVFYKPILEVIPQPHQIDEEKEEFVFKNNFDNVDPKDVYNHFKAGLVDKKYIDLETLETFLKQAFNDYKEGESLKGKLKMNNTTNSLNFIIGVFHKYYSKQVSKHGKKSKYVKLLTDNFIDFEYQKTHDNFRS